MIEVLTAAALNTVQDLGRHGQRRLGVGSSGAMDSVALRVGNILLGNDEAAAGIEIQMFPFAVRFLAPCGFAVTGADCRPSLDGRVLPPWWSTMAGRGQILRLERPVAGARAYLTLAGGLDVPVVLGSRSTHLRSGFGGYEGRSLENGDQLPVRAPEMAPTLALGVEPPPRPSGAVVEIRAIPAAEHADFPGEAQDSFWSASWRVSAQSNRHGYRLAGPVLAGAEAFNLRSTPILPGVVQVPPGGSPIVQMTDANSAGGYPKIATVIAADLPVLGQVDLGEQIRFRECDYEEAVEAERLVSAQVAKIRRVCGLWRQRSAVAVGRRGGAGVAAA